MRIDFLSILFIFHAATSLAVETIECHAPGQGFLEEKLKESFHAYEGESELKEWMMHPKNKELRQELKEIDRRTKFSTRLKKDELLLESRVKFDQIIDNNERLSEINNFPVPGSQSKIRGSEGSLTLEMNNLSKDELDVIPKDILDKLEPKVKINYLFPYDKFEYILTYGGKELSMLKALQKVQQDMEHECEVRKVENKEYRNWYEKNKNGNAPVGGGASRQ